MYHLRTTVGILKCRWNPWFSTDFWNSTTRRCLLPVAPVLGIPIRPNSCPLKVWMYGAGRAPCIGCPRWRLGCSCATVWAGVEPLGKYLLLRTGCVRECVCTGVCMSVCSRVCAWVCVHRCVCECAHRCVRECVCMSVCAHIFPWETFPKA